MRIPELEVVSRVINIPEATTPDQRSAMDSRYLFAPEMVTPTMIWLEARRDDQSSVQLSACWELEENGILEGCEYRLCPHVIYFKPLEITLPPFFCIQKAHKTRPDDIPKGYPASPISSEDCYDSKLQVVISSKFRQTQ